MTLTPALRAQLAAAGILINGLTIHPRPAHCTRCGTSITVALDPHTIGPVIAVNNQPLTPTGEAHALIHGLDTYMLTPDGIEWRDAWRITNCPAGLNDVRADHKCSVTYQTRDTPQKRRTIEDQNRPPPF